MCCLLQDEEAWSCNPFEQQNQQAASRLTDPQESAALSLAEVDAKLEEFALASTEDRDCGYRWVYELDTARLHNACILLSLLAARVYACNAPHKRRTNTYCM